MPDNISSCNSRGSLHIFGQAAIKNSHNTVHLLQRDVQVNHNAGIFITLNPATKGYGGRQKLPDNLKQLFRPAVFSVFLSGVVLHRFTLLLLKHALVLKLCFLLMVVSCSVVANSVAQVAMSVPDNELIAEVMMFAEGFASAKVLAQKKLGEMAWICNI